MSVRSNRSHSSFDARELRRQSVPYSYSTPGARPISFRPGDIPRPPVSPVTPPARPVYIEEEEYRGSEESQGSFPSPQKPGIGIGIATSTNEGLGEREKSRWPEEGEQALPGLGQRAIDFALDVFMLLFAVFFVIVAVMVVALNGTVAPSRLGEDVRNILLVVSCNWERGGERWLTKVEPVDISDCFCGNFGEVFEGVWALQGGAWDKACESGNGRCSPNLSHGANTDRVIAHRQHQRRQRPLHKSYCPKSKLSEHRPHHTMALFPSRRSSPPPAPHNSANLSDFPSRNILPRHHPRLHLQPPCRGSDRNHNPEPGDSESIHHLQFVAAE